MSQYFMSKSRDQEESRGGYSTRSRYLQQQPQQHHQQLPSSNYFQQNNNNYNNQSQSQLNQSEHESYHPSASSYDRHVPQDHSSVGGYGRNDGNLNSRAEYIQSTNYDYQNSSGSRDKYNDYDRNRNHDQGERNWRETPSNNNNHDRYDNSRGFNPNAQSYYPQSQHYSQPSNSNYDYDTPSHSDNQFQSRAYSTQSSSNHSAPPVQQSRYRSPSRSPMHSSRTSYNDDRNDARSATSQKEKYISPHFRNKTSQETLSSSSKVPSANELLSKRHEWIPPNQPPHSQQRNYENTNGPRIKLSRQKKGPDLPSAFYLELASIPSTILSDDSTPPYLILDLNNTLLCRATRSAHGSRNATLRPHLSTFLAYVAYSNYWNPVVYSSARASNVLQMLTLMELVDPARVARHDSSKPWLSSSDEVLKLIWSREAMGLNEWEFNEDVRTVKDLGPVWTALGVNEVEGTSRSILLDDEKDKAAIQPFNHLPISAFSPLNHLQATASPSKNSYRRSRERSPSPFPPTTSSSEDPDSSVPIIPTEDQSLLSTIYLLEQVRNQSNISSFIKEGGLEPFWKLGELELIKRGIEICEDLGIEVKEGGGWVSGWRR